MHKEIYTRHERGVYFGFWLSATFYELNQAVSNFCIKTTYLCELQYSIIIDFISCANIVLYYIVFTQ